jgi:hypothetical protein
MPQKQLTLVPKMPTLKFLCLHGAGTNAQVSKATHLLHHINTSVCTEQEQMHK